MKKYILKIDVLNLDFRKLNPDHMNTPYEFTDLIADVGIESLWVTVDAEGNPTTRIIRSESSAVAGDGQKEIFSDMEDRKLYFTEKDGQDAWPNDKYLKIRITDSSKRNGNLSLAGYANPPASDPRVDGVVMDPRVSGTLEPIITYHNLGRTATHELVSLVKPKTYFCRRRKLLFFRPCRWNSYAIWILFGTTNTPSNILWR